MTKAEAICENKNIDEQAVTLAEAVLALQEKVQTQIPIYKQMSLAQVVKVGTGQSMLRQNPAVGEFRATVRDYAAALKSLQDILDNGTEEVAVSDLDELRKRFKVG